VEIVPIGLDRHRETRGIALQVFGASRSLQAWQTREPSCWENGGCDLFEASLVIQLQRNPSTLLPFDLPPTKSLAKALALSFSTYFRGGEYCVPSQAHLGRCCPRCGPRDSSSSSFASSPFRSSLPSSRYYRRTQVAQMLSHQTTDRLQVACVPSSPSIRQPLYSPLRR